MAMHTVGEGVQTIRHGVNENIRVGSVGWLTLELFHRFNERVHHLICCFTDLRGCSEEEVDTRLMAYREVKAVPHLVQGLR